MTGSEFELLERAALALERIADHLDRRWGVVAEGVKFIERRDLIATCYEGDCDNRRESDSLYCPEHRKGGGRT